MSEDWIDKKYLEISPEQRKELLEGDWLIVDDNTEITREQFTKLKKDLVDVEPTEIERTLLGCTYLEVMQQQQKEWQERNFGAQSAERMLLGICEEVGELVEAFYMSNNFDTDHTEIALLFGAQIYISRLMHAQLKYLQNIRIGNKERSDEYKAEVKSLRMSLHANISRQLTGNWHGTESPVRFRYSLDIDDSLGDALVYMAGFCNAENINISLQKCIEDTWNKVKKRDWKVDPNKGGEK